MAKVLVYDAYANKFYKYNLSENDPMPYSYGNTMRPVSYTHLEKVKNSRISVCSE